MRAILSAPGSRGDVNPMIAIGKRLRQLGHDVVISLAEPYADVAAGAGLDVEPIIHRDRFTEVLSDANVWKPFRGGRAVLRNMAAEFLPLHDEVIRRYHVPGQTVLVAHPLDLASRVFRDADASTPMVSVHLAPAILRTYHAPPRMSPWWFEISRPAWAVKAAYRLIDLVYADPLLAAPVNRLRATYSLAPIRRVMDDWWPSPDRILAMYPDWFAPATRGFAPQLVHCGFPLADVDGGDFSAPTNRPIVFTSGTAHHHCRRFFQQAVRACVALNQPGLLLSTYAENFPEDLPPSVRTMAYASLGLLLPQSSAMVHHGGIGTTSQGLAAGIPQVIRPLAFDQFDNATRVESLGCGVWLRSDRLLADTLQRVLRWHVADPQMSSLREIAMRLHGTDATAHAAAEIEKLMHERLPTN